MNTDIMFSSKTDLWATPQSFYDELDKEFQFTLDPCATPENAKCKKFFTKGMNGLSQNWGVTVSSATLHTERKLANGSRKPMRKVRKAIQQLSCLYQLEQTLPISMIISIIKLKR